MSQPAAPDMSAASRLQSLRGSILRLWRYPVSATMGERLEEASISPGGIVGDREYGLFDSGTLEPVFPSRFKHWNAAPLIASRIAAGRRLELSVEGGAWLETADPRLDSELARIFGRPVSIMRYGEETRAGPAAPRYERSPIHLISRQALNGLLTRLPGSLIDERRFRPNIVVDLQDLSDPVPEYCLLGQEFQLGGIRLRGTRPCGRCSFVTLAQQEIPEDRDVLRTLIGCYEKNFGIYCDVLDEGVLRPGDALIADLPVAPQRPIVIIGAGQAGAMTARALRQLGSEAPIQIFGDERHVPYERPPLSKSISSQDGDALELASVLTPDEAESLRIELHLSTRVETIDRIAKRVETDDGEAYLYDKLVIATGGRARRIPGVARGHGRVLTLRNAEDALVLRRALRTVSSLFILGGGWLGLEVAAAARFAGKQVTLFSRKPRLCPKVLPVEVSDFLLERHRAEGVRFVFGVPPAFREYADRVEAEVDGVVEQAGLLLVAIGMIANDRLARLAGLPCEDGIVTDEAGRTSDPDVFAVGDVARQAGKSRVESWHNANEQARRVAEAVLDKEISTPAPLRFWSEQYDLLVQIVGDPDPSVRPLLESKGEKPFWEFSDFAVGINRSRDLLRYAAERRSTGEERADFAQAPADGRRVRIGKSKDFSAGEIARIEVAEIGAVALGKVGAKYFAVSDKCPHADARLSEGFLAGHRIVCPLHFAEFDIVTGQPYNAPPGCAKVHCYRIIEDGEDLFLVHSVARDSARG